MNIKYKCVCSYKEFIRGNDYEVRKHDLISPYDKSSAGSVYLYYGNTDISFLKTKDEGKMLFMENNIIVLIRQDIWRERLLIKLLNE
jgi:hypothetical protein